MAENTRRDGGKYKCLRRRSGMSRVALTPSAAADGRMLDGRRHSLNILHKRPFDHDHRNHGHGDGCVTPCSKEKICNKFLVIVLMMMTKVVFNDSQ